jgi:hypothetical protein
VCVYTNATLFTCARRHFFINTCSTSHWSLLICHLLANLRLLVVHLSAPASLLRVHTISLVLLRRPTNERLARDRYSTVATISVVINRLFTTIGGDEIVFFLRTGASIQRRTICRYPHPPRDYRPYRYRSACPVLSG